MRQPGRPGWAGRAGRAGMAGWRDGGADLVQAHALHVLCAHLVDDVLGLALLRL